MKSTHGLSALGAFYCQNRKTRKINLCCQLKILVYNRRKIKIINSKITIMNKKEKILQLMQRSLLYDGKEQLSRKAMSLVAYVYADTDKYWDDLLQEKLQPGIYSFGNLMIVYCQMAKEIATLLMPVKDTVLAGIDENIGEDINDFAKPAKDETAIAILSHFCKAYVGKNYGDKTSFIRECEEFAAKEERDGQKI